MDRRSFLRPLAPPPGAAAPSPPPDPPFEYLPGHFSDPRLPIRWTATQAERPAARPLPGEPLRTQTGLEPFTPSADAPWDRRRALHLLRRTGFGARPADADAVLALTPGAAVDALVDAALAAPLPPAPPWIDEPLPPPDAPDGEVQAYIEANVQWVYDTEHGVYREALGLRAAGTAFRERLALMWHNHFVTGIEDYFLAPWLWRYWTLLRTHALGDLRQFVHEIGLTPAMLIYLNGIQNRVGEPNENYARELLELFTMGITGPDGTPNYTQQDIEELARALTGWTVDLYGTLESVFIPPWHDGGTKTIFGQTGPWGYNDVVPLLFGQRAPEIAHHIATVLYREFVYEVPDPAIVAALAAELEANDFQLEPTVRTLLRSAHFFDAATIGARVKSPAALTLGLYHEIGLAEDLDLFEITRFVMALTNQRLFQPPNVAGWPGYRAWLDANSLPLRWLYGDAMLPQQQTLQALALALPNPFDPYALTADFTAHFFAIPASPEDLAAYAEILLNGIPDYEWNPNDPGAEARLLGLAAHLLRLPEYQLT